MKYNLFLFLFTLRFIAASQDVHEIRLSKTLNETRMGLWTSGDYDIYVEMTTLETSFQNTYKNYLNASLNRNNVDTVTSALYNITSKRYQVAADQMKLGENGFDLRKLILYFGLENDKENAGNSFIVENFITQLVENGTAVVFYKGERIYTLKKKYEPEGEGLNFGYHIRIYYDDPEKCIVRYYRHLGW